MCSYTSLYACKQYRLEWSSTPCLMQNKYCAAERSTSCRWRKEVASHVQCSSLACPWHQRDQHHTYGFLCPTLTALLNLQCVCHQSGACCAAQACCATGSQQPADTRCVVVMPAMHCPGPNQQSAMLDHRAVILDGLGRIPPEQKLLASVSKAETCHHTIFCML